MQNKNRVIALLVVLGLLVGFTAALAVNPEKAYAHGKNCFCGRLYLITTTLIAAKNPWQSKTFIVTRDTVKPADLNAGDRVCIKYKNDGGALVALEVKKRVGRHRCR